MRGVVPSWARDSKIGNRLINARAGTVATKPAFRRPFRMPLILGAGTYDLWLEPAVQDIERLEKLLASHPADALAAYPVSTRVNNPANDSPDLLAPLAR